MADAAGEVELKPVWRRDAPGIVADAKAFWARLGVLPPSATAEERARQLAVAAYLDDRLIAVSTLALGDLAAARCRVGWFRCLVDPAHRQRGLSRALAVASRDVLRDWAEEHPAEKVMGMATVVESPALDAFARKPVWPASGLGLIGYTPQGRQVRVVWFEHARLD